MANDGMNAVTGLLWGFEKVGPAMNRNCNKR